MNNRMNNRMKILPIMLLIAVPFALCSEGFTLADEREHWMVGIAAFEERSLSPENLYLTHSFPLLLRERLEAIPRHYFGEEEQEAYRSRIIRKEEQRLVSAVGSDRRARDELFFSAAGGGTAAYDQRIADNLEALRELREADPRQISFPQSKELRFASGADGQLIYDSPVLSPLQLATREDLDVLIWGKFEEVRGFLFFEVDAYNAVLGQPVFSYSDAAAPAEIYDRMDPLIEELASVLWGRDWSSLTVETVPSRAAVWIDDSFRGRSPLRVPYLLPGTTEIRVESPGYRREQRTVELAPGSEGVERFTLLAQPADAFSLDSDPEGAAVYRGSEWLGTTPLDVDKPQELSRILLRREGYLDFPLYVDSDFAPTATAALVPEDVEPAALQGQRREELYRAFGYFALSIPVPIFLWGYGYDYRVMAAQAGAPASAQLTADTLSYLSYGTTAVCAGLFVNLLVRVIRYLRAADRRS
ncbi:MAG: PEGA domain-containing protein, partial [Spirochaetales bacterium]|nr:PEGA domain-containing protein [Spirochaetales bacterium]